MSCGCKHYNIDKINHSSNQIACLLGEVLDGEAELRVDVLERRRGTEAGHAERRVGPALPPLDAPSLHRHHGASLREHCSVQTGQVTIQVT